MYTVNDPISDMINQINNAQDVNMKYIFLLSSKLKISILNVLKKEGYIKNFFNLIENKKKFLIIKLKYYKNKSVIQVFKRVSKLSLRVYRDYKRLPRIMNGLGISIISTIKGVITDKEARKLGIGGEVICYVF